MQVFKLEADANHYQSIAPQNDAGFDLLRWLDGTPHAQSWVPVNMLIVDPELPPSDFPGFRSAAPIFSLRAVEALGDLLQPNGELLPLICPDGDYFVFNVTAMPDILDEDRSEIRRFRSGRILDITGYQFRGSSVGSHVIFRLPQLPTGRVYVTDEFVQRVAASGLTGFEFPSVWTDQ